MKREGSFIRHPFVLLLLVGGLAALAGCSTDSDEGDGGAAEAKDDKLDVARLHGSKADTDIDALCQRNGWLDDGECDTFCTDDPDCEVVVEPPPDPVVGGGEGEGEGEGEDEGEPAETDPWAPALDVEQMIVRIDAPAPAGYPYPRVGTGFSLGGTEFWQKWAEGHNPTYSYGAGTEEGKRCMVASAMRFEAIMAEPPAALVALRDDSDWGGSFFNWNDDYSNSTSGDASSSVLWAWRTHLIKWISQTSRDGACYLPTRALVVAAAEACARRAAADGGAIQGCQARP